MNTAARRLAGRPMALKRPRLGAVGRRSCVRLRDHLAMDSAMTGWIDRINRAILRRVASRSRVSANAEGVVLGEGGQYSYADLKRVVAFRQANWVGDVFRWRSISGQATSSS